MGVYQADCGGDLVTSFDIASTGECLIFADSGGYIYLYSYVCAFNTLVRACARERMS